MGRAIATPHSHGPFRAHGDTLNGITHRRAFWALYALVSLAALGVALRLFPLAIPIVNLDVTMSRGDALVAARSLAARLQLAPADARAAVRFSHDSETQNYVELEGGGKPAFARLTQGDVYVPYWWEVRLFTLGSIDETAISLKPDGTPLGFARKLPESYVRDAAHAALDAAAARAIAQSRATRDWGVDLAHYTLLEQSQQTQPSGRVDHSYTYERPERLGEARVRLRLTVAGDELVGVAQSVHIPESFDRRYEELRSSNNLIANLATASAGLLYGIGGAVLGGLWLARRRWLVSRPAIVAGLVVGGLLALASLASADAAWFGVDTTETLAMFWAKRAGAALLIASAGGLAYALVFMAAESLSRRAFPHQPQLWRLWSRHAAASPQVAGRTLGGYLFVPIELALVAVFYYVTNRWFGWWQPSEVLTDPNILGSSIPALTPIAISLQAGFMEECVFRAIPLALGALIGAHYGRRRWGIALAVILQAVIFGGAHANYPGFPAYSRPVELLLPSIVWALIFLRFGLLPTILLHATFDLTLFSIPLFLVDAPGARGQQWLVVAAALLPLAVVGLRRVQAGAWRELPASLLNAAWRPRSATAEPSTAHADPLAPGTWTTRFQRTLPWLGVAGLVAWALLTPFRSDAPPLRLDRAFAVAAADAALTARGVTLGPQWHRYAVVHLASDDPQQWEWHKFVWREAGPAAYHALVGSVLAPPVWEVRYATFSGDVAQRAEEWRVTVSGDAKLRTVTHSLPESRAGAQLDRDAALAIAKRELAVRFGVDAAALQLVAADEQARPARADWSFIFGDPHAFVGAGGQARYAVAVDGDEVAGAGRFVHVPESWSRAEREHDNALQVVTLAAGAVAFAAALAALLVGVNGWIRRRVDARALLAAFAMTFTVTLLMAVNAWPVTAMQLSTTEPVAAQLTMKLAGVVLVAFGGALIVGLCAGVGAFGARASLPLARSGRWRWIVGAVSAGAFVVGLQAAMGVLATPDAPRWPQAPWASLASPIAGALLSGLSFVAIASLQLFVVHVVSRITRGFSRRPWLAVVIIVILECAAALTQGGGNIAGSLAAGAIAGLAASAVLWLLLRYDPRLVPAFAATVTLLGGAARALQSGAVPLFAIDAAATILVAWAMTRYLSLAADETTRG